MLPDQDHTPPGHAAAGGQEAAEAAGDPAERGAAEEALPRLRHDSLAQAAHTASPTYLITKQDPLMSKELGNVEPLGS